MNYLHFQDFNTPSDESFNSPFTDPNAQKSYQKPISSHIPTDNLGSDAATIDLKKPHFLSFQFYQRYFDVDTSQVQTRILNSMFPKRNSNFLSDFIQPTPDLYGPFWICVTLIFSTAICGNFVRYAQKEPSSTYESDFGLVTGSMSLIASYVLLVPFAIYSVLWYRKSLIQYSYMELLCAYGYSLSIFIPVSILWVIQIYWFRWLIIISSVLLSGAVLVNSLWPTVRGDTNRLVVFSFITGVVLMHALLAICFKEFYFDTSMPTERTASIVKNEQQLRSQLITLEPLLEKSKTKLNSNGREELVVPPLTDSQTAPKGTYTAQKTVNKGKKENKDANMNSTLIEATSSVSPGGNTFTLIGKNTEEVKKANPAPKKVLQGVHLKEEETKKP